MIIIFGLAITESRKAESVTLIPMFIFLGLNIESKSVQTMKNEKLSINQLYQLSLIYNLNLNVSRGKDMDRTL